MAGSHVNPAAQCVSLMLVHAAFLCVGVCNGEWRQSSSLIHSHGAIRLLFTEATTLAKAGIIILSENRAVDVIKSL